MNLTKQLYLFLLIALSTTIMPINAGESYRKMQERQQKRCYKVKLFAAITALVSGTKIASAFLKEYNPYEYAISSPRCHDFPTWLNHIKDNNLVACTTDNTDARPGIAGLYDCSLDQNDESGLFCMKTPGSNYHSIFKISRESGDTFFKYRPIECSDLTTLICDDTDNCFETIDQWSYDPETETEYSLLCLQDPTTVEGAIARIDRARAGFFVTIDDNTNERD